MEQLSQLKAYQAVDVKISEIENEVKNSQVRKKLMRARNYLVSSQQNMQNMDASAVEIRGAYDVIFKKYQQVAQMLDAAQEKSASLTQDSPLSQVESLRKESQDLLTLLGRLEKDLQKMVETLASIETKVKSIAQNVPRAKKDYTEAKKDYDANVLQMNDKIKPLRKQLKDMEKKLDAALIKKYRSAKQNHMVPLVAVSGNRCTGCNMELPAVTMERARSTSSLLECENCGRLLYIAGDS